MDLKIVGWTNYDSSYPSIALTNEEINGVLGVVVKEILANKYVFSGEEHQNMDTGVPVFDNGTCFRASMRAWGAIMTIAYPETTDGKTNYMDFYMSTPVSVKIPKTAPIAVAPMASDNFSGFIIGQDREVLSESLATGIPFITTDKALNRIMDGVKKKQDAMSEQA